MKKIANILQVFIAAMAALGLSGCAREELSMPDIVEEGVPITVTLNLSGTSTSDIVVDTKASGSEYSELSNLTIYIYDGNGKYQKTVGTSDRTLILENPEGTEEIIYPVSFETTSGKKKLLALGNRGGGFWSASGDLDVSQMTFEQLKDYLLELNYPKDGQSGEMSTPIQIVSDDQMLISGWNEGITFGTDGKVKDWGSRGNKAKEIAVRMKRIMAHVTFKIPSGSSEKTVEGVVHTVTFIPTSYRIYNVPVKSMLTNMDNALTTLSEDSFVNVATSNIGTAEAGNYTFDFFMPENVYNEESVENYNDRDSWQGDPGTTASRKDWVNAPKKSTFVVISGTYEEKGPDGNLVYTGNVQYTIHLGDFSGNKWGNFSIERNCSYTYNVKVQGVDQIIVEAKKDEDGQNGAEGQIYSYEGTVFTYNLDAHYESVYLEYNLSSIAEAVHAAISAGTELSVDDAIANNLILVIQSEAMDYTANNEYYTTRNKRGTLKPYKIYVDGLHNPEVTKESVLGGEGTGAVPTKGFDYKWVELWPQGGSTIATYPGVSEWSREDISTMKNPLAYGGEPTENSKKLIDVYDAIVGMGKAVKFIYGNKYERETNGIVTGEINGDGIFITEENDEYKVRFTAFVNEYYYYKHPLTGAQVDSWSVFVNKIPREMIIAMSSDVSYDGNSSYSQVYSYISQLSMQTFYNDRTVRLNAFGIETYNETPLYYTFGSPVSENNLTDNDGRTNQKTLIGAGSSPQWSKYINSSGNGWTSSVGTDHPNHKLQNAYNITEAYLACMSRNRDLNGDGTIDENEIRWYLASLNEYIRIGIGSDAISSAAQLYIGDKSVMTSGGYPTSYINDGALFLTSSGGNKRVFWAVEKGAYSTDDKTAKPIRCIRLLPSTDSNIDITSIDGVQTDPTYIKHEANSQHPTILEFKDRLVPSLYRQRVGGEGTVSSLGIHDEDDPENYFYDGIYVAEDYLKQQGPWWNPPDAYYDFGKLLGKGSTSLNNPCADYEEHGIKNWRLPNLVELLAMDAAGLLDDCAADDVFSPNRNVASCTQFSNQNVRLGFVRTNGIGCYYTWDIEKKIRVRCVRDVPEGYEFPTN